MPCLGSDFRFTLKADVYYAVLEQNSWGEFEKTWSLSHTGTMCELHSDKFNSDTRYAIQTKDEFFKMPLLVFGRFREDIRVDKDGTMHPLTDIVVSNVRGYCGGDPVFYDSASGEPTKFEIGTFEPFTNPWGKIEYYKVQAIRSDDQDMF